MGGETTRAEVIGNWRATPEERRKREERLLLSLRPFPYFVHAPHTRAINQ